jgi:uncharacterized protein (DUF58 family)
MHDSRNRGGGLEFAQYRAYERGDDLRRVDWKLYARSDRFFVREAERESPVALWVVIDASASMAQADLGRPDWTRFDAARRIAASLIHIALRQGDRFGLILEGPEALAIAPQPGPRHRDHVLRALASVRAAGVANWERDSATFGERISAHDLTLILSDGFDEACITLAERMAATGRDVALIQIFTADERDFPFDGGYLFEDLESEAQLVGDGRSLRDDFLSRFAAARAARASRLAAKGIRHVVHFIDETADQPIRALFKGAAR